MIDLEDSSTWDRTPEGLLICPACHQVASLAAFPWVMIAHTPDCNLPQWDDEDEE